MSRYILYQQNEKLGPHNIPYIKDALPAISKSGEKDRQAYFKCPYCEKSFIARIKDIKNGKIQSCGCVSSKLRSKKIKENLLNQRFGHLTVVKEIPFDKQNQTRTKWLCQCDCGKELSVFSESLKQGKTKSCGDKKCPYYQEIKQEASRKNILGKKFGQLTVIEKTNKKDNYNNFLWKCQCDCGNIIEVPTTSLLSGNTRACGCVKSFYEKEIYRILTEELQITTIKEKSFLGCINPKTNKKLRFDFYLPKYNLCIEYNGKQHYTTTGTKGWNTSEKLKDLQYRDNIKMQFCHSNGIKLIIIPYWDRQNISSNYLLQLIKKEMGDFK